MSIKSHAQCSMSTNLPCSESHPWFRVAGLGVAPISACTTKVWQHVRACHASAPAKHAHPRRALWYVAHSRAAKSPKLTHHFSANILWPGRRIAHLRAVFARHCVEKARTGFVPNSLPKMDRLHGRLDRRINLGGVISFAIVNAMSMPLRTNNRQLMSRSSFQCTLAPHICLWHAAHFFDVRARRLFRSIRPATWRRCCARSCIDQCSCYILCLLWRSVPLVGTVEPHPLCVLSMRSCQQPLAMLSIAVN